MVEEVIGNELTGKSWRRRELLRRVLKYLCHSIFTSWERWALADAYLVYSWLRRGICRRAVVYRRSRAVVVIVSERTLVVPFIGCWWWWRSELWKRAFGYLCRTLAINIVGSALAEDLYG